MMGRHISLHALLPYEMQSSFFLSFCVACNVLDSHDSKVSTSNHRSLASDHF
jgi:hypothetical protein